MKITLYIFSLITLLNQLEITYTVWTKKIYATLFFNKIYLPFLEDSIENKIYNRFDLFAHTLRGARKRSGRSGLMPFF